MTKRIFIALDISAEVRTKIAVLTGGLRAEFPNLRMGWEKPEKIHLTLKFLGDIDERQIASLSEAVKRTADESAAFSLRMERTGCFPSAKKARVLWLGLTDGSGNLQKLQGRLEKEAEARGFEKEDRSFKPHLTIARLREPDKSRVLVDRFLQTEFEPVSFEVSEVLIYESKLQPMGSVYSVVSKHRLLLV
jgi:RNA 2',3'-cyclic 3'-phosphodiesterase